jgi:hypothetical protein
MTNPYRALRAKNEIDTGRNRDCFTPHTMGVLAEGVSPALHLRFEQVQVFATSKGAQNREY